MEDGYFYIKSNKNKEPLEGAVARMLSHGHHLAEAMDLKVIESRFGGDDPELYLGKYAIIGKKDIGTKLQRENLYHELGAFVQGWYAGRESLTNKNEATT